MLHEIDDALQALMTDEMGRIPGCPIYNLRQVTLETPGDALRLRDGEANVNLYLYDVRENVELRDEGSRRPHRPGVGGDAGMRPAPTRVDLSYLITAHAGGDTRTEHHLLSDAYAVLLRSPVLPAAYLTPALQALGPCLVSLQVAFPGDLSRADLSALWQALDGPLRPALHLVVTFPFDTGVTRWTKVVLEAPRVTLLPSAPVLVTGIVLDGNRETPLAGAVVMRTDGPGSPPESGTLPESDAEGIFILPPLSPGIHTLSIRHEGYRVAYATVTVPPPDRVGTHIPPVVIALRPE